MTRSFVIPAASNGSPDSAARKRRMAEIMLAQSAGAEPISSPWQGAAKLAQALMGGLAMKSAERSESKGREGANAALLRALTGDAGVAPSQSDPMGALVQGINDPWQSEMGQRMLWDKYQRDNTPPDPMKDLQRQKLELELGQMRNPQPEYRPATPEEKQQWGVAPDAPLVIGKDGKPSILSDGKTTVNVGGGSDKQIFDETKARADAARAANTGLNAVNSAEKALPGAITGAAANERLGLQKIGSLFGVGDTQAIQDTETFRAAIAPQIAALMKATVGSTQISNADREFAEKAAGGSITLDAGSIERLLVIARKANTEIVRGFNRDLGAVYPEGQGFDRERALFNVPQAPAFGAPQGPATMQGQGPREIMPSMVNRQPGPELGAMPPPAATPPIPSPALGAVGSNPQGKGDMGNMAPPKGWEAEWPYLSEAEKLQVLQQGIQ